MSTRLGSRNSRNWPNCGGILPDKAGLGRNMFVMGGGRASMTGIVEYVERPLSLESAAGVPPDDFFPRDQIATKDTPVTAAVSQQIRDVLRQLTFWSATAICIRDETSSC
jgi:hypothetical protein